ncbi:phytoene/squalene synthase family protein [Nafulsella turpanensis]|uniref:phytoene/squalene synthase family protein n=1 Tax=Nafulsella turpanensis TaxID=1265690 RepID=UPI00034DA5EE|nr:phytoene/squalene synthase family protein [Nafulsella turpanensis]
MELFSQTTYECSKLITQRYSTSFTLGIKTLDKRFHMPIYAIYGFVRYADEIVDTFHEHDKAKLLKRFRHDTRLALEEKISLNPVLHCFQEVVHQYKIETALIDAFLDSMAMDLQWKPYDQERYQEYIFGSAEAVGLMCLRVFCEGDTEQYEKLRAPAKSLGAAFQKVNFLRDIRSDYNERGRVYFPGVNFKDFSLSEKTRIEEDIENDFKHAYEGILALPKGARMGVYLAYIYYLKLFNKIKNSPASTVINQRIRIDNQRKLSLLIQTMFRFKFNYL